MPRRTIPQQFPALSERDAHNHTPLRAKLLRNIAMAQNYLWARMTRLYATGAVEGWGNELVQGYNYPAAAIGSTPMGFSGLCVASFICPPNWGAGNLLKIQGRSSLTLAGTGTGWVGAEIYGLDNISTSIRTSASYSTNGTNNWTLYLHAPRDRFVLVRIFIANEGLAGGDVHSVDCLSARYEVPTAAELGIDNLSSAWAPLAYSTTAADEPFSSALVKLLIRDTNHLHAYRNPELLQTWLGRHYADTSTWAEVARYVVYIPSCVTHIKLRGLVFCTHDGANTALRVKINGSTTFTTNPLPLGESEVDLAEQAVTPGAETTLTIEAQSDAGGADWGTILNGVWAWEETVDLALSDTTPSEFQPLDEDLLVANRAVLAEESGTDRAGLRTLLENNVWLARHRLRWLIGDWRHRILRRRANHDWTPGPEETTDNLYSPKNITLAAGYADASGGSTSPHEERDGLSRWPDGEVDEDSIDLEMGIDTVYLRHGRRLGRYRSDTGAGTSPLNSVSGARLRFYVRGRRLGRYFDDTGEYIDAGRHEGEPLENQGYFYINTDASPVVAYLRSSLENKDTDPQCLGPVFGLWSDMDTAFSVHGALPHPAGLGSFSAYGEGYYQEMEAQTALVIDEPLGQAEIDALD